MCSVAGIAQLGERQTEDLKVACSIHAHRNNFVFFAPLDLTFFFLSLPSRQLTGRLLELLLGLGFGALIRVRVRVFLFAISYSDIVHLLRYAFALVSRTAKRNQRKY